MKKTFYFISYFYLSEEKIVPVSVLLSIHFGKKQNQYMSPAAFSYLSLVLVWSVSRYISKCRFIFIVTTTWVLYKTVFCYKKFCLGVRHSSLVACWSVARQTQVQIPSWHPSKPRQPAWMNSPAKVASTEVDGQPTYPEKKERIFYLL